MAVDDIEIIPPNNTLLTRPQPNANPTKKPKTIINETITNAAIIAVRPTLINFLKLKSNPKLNNKKMIPISAHVPMSEAPETVGVKVI